MSENNVLYDYPFNNASGATDGYGANPVSDSNPYILPTKDGNSLSTPSVKQPDTKLTQAGADAISGGLKAATTGLAAGLTLSAQKSAREEAAELAKGQLARDVANSEFEAKQQGISTANDRARIQMNGQELDLMAQISKAARNVQKALANRTFHSDAADKVREHINENAAYAEYIRQSSRGVK